VDKRSVGAVDLPEDTQLAHLEKRLAAVEVDQYAFEDFVHIMRFAAKVLIVPTHLPGIRVERER
jgi:hypothetical protein